jgi:hypothetical protein
MSPEDEDKRVESIGFPKDETAAHALLFGLIHCGFEPVNNFDRRLPAGTVRIVVGKR